MQYIKLRSIEIREKFSDFFAEHNIWFPSHHDSQEQILKRMRRSVETGLSDCIVVIDDCAGNKMVGFASTQTEITITKGGAPTVTITDFYVLPAYESVKVLLLHRIVRAAIAGNAIVLRAIVPPDVAPFLKGELFQETQDHCLLERTLPTTRYKKYPPKPRQMQREMS